MNGEYPVLKIDPQEINKMVSQAILDSVIGERLKSAIVQSLDRLSQGYPSVLNIVVEEEVKKIIRGILLSEPVYTQLKSAVKEHATEEIISKLTFKCLEGLRL